MNPTELALIKKASGELEKVLKSFENILEEKNNQNLYRASEGIISALKFLHEMDGSNLNPENQNRISEINEKSKPKSGRDSFNTGF